MKKILSLLALVLMSCMGAWAQATTWDLELDANDGAYYRGAGVWTLAWCNNWKSNDFNLAGEETTKVILDTNGANNMYYAGASNGNSALDNAFFRAQIGPLKFSLSNPDYIIKKISYAIGKANQNGVVVYSNATDYYTRNTNSETDVTISDMAVGANTYSITFSGTNSWVEFKNITVTVEKLSKKDVNVTYRVNGSESDKFTKTVSLSIGSTNWLSEVALDYYTGATSSTESITAETENVTVDVTPAFPFQTGKFYQIKNKNQNYLKNVDAENISTKNAANNMSVDMFWQFVRVANTQNQFTIASLKDGASWYGTTGKMALSTENATSFQILKKDNFFNIYTGNANEYVGAHANYTDANSAVGYWNGGNANEDGSQWTVLEFDESLFTGMDTPASFVGSIIATDVAKSAAAAYMADKTAAKLKTALEACADLTVKGIEAGKYYRLKCQDTNRSDNYLYSDIHANTNGEVDDAGADHRLVKSQSATSVINTLFLFEKDGENNAYYIQHVNSGKYLCASTSGNVDLPFVKANAGTYEPAQVSGKWWGIKRTGTNVHLHQSNHADKKLLLWGALNAEPASNWSIEEVEQLPVTINESKWASACYPVAVTLPEDLTAYYAQSASAEGIVLKEIEGGVIPANTPVLLTGEAGDYTLTIGGTATAIEGNLLTGTTILRQGFESAEGFRYGLSNGEFQKITGNVIAANKAYYTSATDLTPATSALRIYVSEGALTSINSVNTNANNGAYYDLNGRMVAYPTTGIYVHNGKKVFIK